ncbi:MAG: DoxX family protein [Sphingobacteriaceae bacterium]
MKNIVFENNGKTNELAQALLRVAFGFLLIINGWAKAINFSSYSADFPDPLHLGETVSLFLVIFAELFCGLLILLGLLTRFFSIPVLITFVVAVLAVHQNDPFDAKQAALLYLCLSIYFIMTGSGRYSLDNKLFHS